MAASAEDILKSLDLTGPIEKRDEGWLFRRIARVTLTIATEAAWGAFQAGSAGTILGPAGTGGGAALGALYGALWGAGLAATGECLSASQRSKRLNEVLVTGLKRLTPANKAAIAERCRRDFGGHLPVLFDEVLAADTEALTFYNKYGFDEAMSGSLRTSFSRARDALRNELEAILLPKRTR